MEVSFGMIRLPRVLWWVLAGALMLHGAMFIYDIAHPHVFLHADRAYMRLDVAEGFLSAWHAGDVLTYLASHGAAGDYVVHAVLLHLGGANLIIVVQVLLTLLASLGVYRIARLLGWSERLAVSSCTLFIVLPHTIVFPHQLLSEALSVPLIVISLWAIAECSHRWSRNTAYLTFLVIGALLCGVATLIRPVTLLWPMVIGLVLWLTLNAKVAWTFTLISYLPVLSWMVFIALHTGTFGMGESSFDMKHNLYKRVARISQAMPASKADQVRANYLTEGDRGTLSGGEYLKFGLDFPQEFMKHALRDVAQFVGKSGVERLTVDYLELDPELRSSLQDRKNDAGWRRLLEREGVWATIQYLWQVRGGIVAISAVGVGLMLLSSFFAFMGGICMLRQTGRRDGARLTTTLLIVILPIYILIFSQAVNAAQSRHRAPAEGALVLLVTAGAACLIRRASSYLENRKVTSGLA